MAKNLSELDVNAQMAALIDVVTHPTNRPVAFLTILAKLVQQALEDSQLTWQDGVETKTRELTPLRKAIDALSTLEDALQLTYGHITRRPMAVQGNVTQARLRALQAAIGAGYANPLTQLAEAGFVEHTAEKLQELLDAAVYTVKYYGNHFSPPVTIQEATTVLQEIATLMGLEAPSPNHTVLMLMEQSRREVENVKATLAGMETTKHTR